MTLRHRSLAFLFLCTLASGAAGLRAQSPAPAPYVLQAAFVADVTNGAAPLTVQFTDLSTPADSVRARWWDLDGDGVTDSNVRNPSWVYDIPGTFTVRLIVSDTTVRDTAFAVITVTPTPDANVAVRVRVVEEGGTRDAYDVQLWGYAGTGLPSPVAPVTLTSRIDSSGTATFNRYQWLNVFSQDMRELVVRDRNGAPLGHIGFSFKLKDFSAGRRKEAWLVLHRDLATYAAMPLERAGQAGGNTAWMFANYIRFPWVQGVTIDDAQRIGTATAGVLRQTTLLVPPMNPSGSSPNMYLFANVRTAKVPLVMVHGAGGSDEYWGGNTTIITPADTSSPVYNNKIDYPFTSTSARVQRRDRKLYDRFDVWEYYLPPDQAWTQSGYLFARDLTKVLAQYTTTQAMVAAHGAGGLAVRAYIEGTAANISGAGAPAPFISYRGDVRKVIFLGAPENGTLGAAALYWDILGGTSPSGGVRDAFAPVWRELAPGSAALKSLNAPPITPAGVGYMQLAGTPPTSTANTWVEAEAHDNTAVALNAASLLHRGADLGLLAGYTDDMFRRSDPPEWTVNTLKRPLLSELILAYVISDTTLPKYASSFAAYFPASNPNFGQIEYYPTDGRPFRVDRGLPAVDFIVDGLDPWKAPRNTRFQLQTDLSGQVTLMQQDVNGTTSTYGDPGVYLYASGNSFTTSAFKRGLASTPGYVAPTTFYGVEVPGAQSPLHGGGILARGLGWEYPFASQYVVPRPLLAFNRGPGEFRYYRVPSGGIALDWTRTAWSGLDITRHVAVVMDAPSAIAFRGGMTGDSLLVDVDCQTPSVTFMVDYGGGTPPALSVLSPSDSLISEAQANDTTVFFTRSTDLHIVYLSVLLPEAGTWKMLLNGNCAQGSPSWRLVAPAVTQHAMRFALAPGQPVAGDSAVVRLWLDDRGALSGMSASCRALDSLGRATTVVMRDDGQAPDSLAADGIFSGRWVVPFPGTFTLQTGMTAIANGCQIRRTGAQSVTAPVRLELLAPIGGELWQAATTQQIRWRGAAAQFVALDYSTNSGADWVQVADSIPAAAGTWDWTVPATPSENCLVRVRDAGRSWVFATSPARFRIYLQPEVQLTAPNGGEVWRAGTVRDITWTSTAVPSVDIVYTTDNGANWLPVASAAPADAGAYSWTVPDTPSDVCLVRLISTADPLVSDQSDHSFAIEAVPAITVLAPNGGERWVEGSAHTVRWSSVNVSQVDVYYSVNGGYTWLLIAPGISATAGQHTWTVPSTITDSCLILVAQSAGGQPADRSDDFFSIIPMPALTLLAPNGGEIWEVASQQDIRWTSRNITAVDIRYSTNAGARWTVVALNQPAASGTFRWTVPNQASTSCKVRISDTHDTSTWVESAAVFEISESLTRPTLFAPADASTGVSVTPRFMWLPFAEADTFRIQVSRNLSFTQRVLDSTGVTGTSLEGPRFQGSTTYYWRMRGERTGWNSQWSEVWRFTTAATPLGPPTLLSPANNALGLPTSVNLEWQAMQNAFDYHLQVATDVNFTQLTLDETGITATSRALTGLSMNADYWWRVRARGSSLGVYGDWSASWRFSTAPSPPRLLTPPNGMTDVALQPIVQWYPYSGAQTYRLQVAKDANFSQLVFDSAGYRTTSARLPVLTSFTTYYWRLNVTAARGASDWCTPWFFRTLDVGTAADGVPVPGVPDLGPVHPNPLTGVGEIAVTLALATEARLEVCDVHGRVRAVLLDRRLEAGTHRIGFFRGTLPAGIYFCRLTTPEGAAVRKMLVAD